MMINLPPSLCGDVELLEEPLHDGKSSIKRAATRLASEGDQRSLLDFQIVEARLFTAWSFGSRARRAASSQPSMSRRARADNTLKGASPFSCSGANRNRSNGELM